MGAARSGESRCGLRTEKGSAISALSSSRVGGGPVSSGYLVEFVIYSNTIYLCNISALAGSSIVLQNNVPMCPVKDQIHPICKISVPFCAFPPPSGFRSIPLWLGVVGGVLNMHDCAFMIHGCTIYCMSNLNVTATLHLDFFPSWASRSSMLE
jgi:hypothetical protein